MTEPNSRLSNVYKISLFVGKYDYCIIALYMIKFLVLSNIWRIKLRTFKIAYPITYPDLLILLISKEITNDEFDDAFANNADKIFGKVFSQNSEIKSVLEHYRDELSNLENMNKKYVTDIDRKRIEELKKFLVKYESVAPLSYADAFCGKDVYQMINFKISDK